MYEARKTEQTLNLSAFEIEDVVKMLKVLYSPEEGVIYNLGDEKIKIEIKTKSSHGSSYDLNVQFVDMIWVLLYIIPRKLGLRNVIVDVNHKPGLYEYVAQKYRDFFNEEETKKEEEKAHRPSLPDEAEWPEASLDGC